MSLPVHREGLLLVDWSWHTDRRALEGPRDEETIAELCCKEGIARNLYYRWSKEFLGAGKKRLAGDMARQANTDEVKDQGTEARGLCRRLSG